MGKTPKSSKNGEVTSPAKKSPAKSAGRAKTAAKSATKPKAVKASRPASSVSSFGPEEIALRAYFLAEKRQKLGLPGDSAHDWIEAERQLKAELKPKKAAIKKAAPKKVKTQ